MSLSVDQQNALKLEFQNSVYSGLTSAQAFDLLNNAQQINTVVNAPQTLTIVALLGLLSPASIAKLANWPTLVDLRDKIVNQDITGVVLYGEVLVAAQIITQDEFTSISKYVETQVQQTVVVTIPARISTKFNGVTGMPNYIVKSDFDSIWVGA